MTVNYFAVAFASDKIGVKGVCERDDDVIGRSRTRGVHKVISKFFLSFLLFLLGSANFKKSRLYLV